MGLFSPTVVDPSTDNTPESLTNVLLEAASDRDALIAEAEREYELDKAWVLDTATTRVTAVNGLLDELKTEKDALDEVIEKASA